jgi:hypothetical protein
VYTLTGETKFFLTRSLAMKTYAIPVLLIFATFMTTGCSMNPNKTSSHQFSADKSISSSQLTNQNIETVQRYTSGWPETSVKAATRIISRFGEPQESTSSLLIWRNVSPFKRITVFKDGVEHKFPLLHKDVIEHVVDYKVAPEKLEELSRFEGSLIYNRTAGELASRSHDEAMNILALNLAHEIVTQQRKVSDARAEFGKVTMDFMNGNKTDYMERLQFSRQMDTADADQPSKLNWATAPQVPIQAEEAQPVDEMKEYQRPVNVQEMEKQEATMEDEELLEKAQKEELAE